MKKFLAAILIFSLLIILQASVLPAFFAEWLVPNLLLLAAVSGTVVFGFSSLWIWIILGGLVADIFFHSPLGLHVVILIPSAYLASFFNRRLMVENRGLGILAITGIVLILTILDRLFFRNFLSGKLIAAVSDWSGFSPGFFLSAFVIDLIIFLLSYAAMLNVKKRLIRPGYSVSMVG